MADLVLDWGLFGTYGTNLNPIQTVDTGGVEVTVDFVGTDEGAHAFTFNSEGYVGTGEPFSAYSFLKLFGEGGEGGVDDTSTTTISFAASNPLFSDEVQNVSFRINDIDVGMGDVDPLSPNHLDILNIKAYDAAGNEVPVTISLGADVNPLGTSGVLGGAEAWLPTDAQASALVSIVGPVASVVIDFDNGDIGSQRVMVSDIHFSTIAAAPDYIVEGTVDDDLIDFDYTGDPDGDLIDHNDNAPGRPPQQDTVMAYGGDDTIHAGEGDDVVDGGEGDDLIDGGAGNDTLFGNDGRDTFINVNQGDEIDGGAGPVNDGPDDYDTLDLRGSATPGGSLNVTYTSGDRQDGFVTYFDGDGNETGTLNFLEIENVVPCFTPGTAIATPKGERMVEDLAVGDKIVTRDNGIQEIRWIGRRSLTGHELARAPHLRPILIQKGALGDNLPEHDILVSPQHRLLLSDDRTQLYFEEREVLAAAKHLTDLPGVDEVGTLGVSYVHFMFDQHEVVLSNGAWTESFQPGANVLDGIGAEQRDEILQLFPELKTVEGVEDYTAARRALKKHEARLLVL